MSLWAEAADDDDQEESGDEEDGDNTEHPGASSRSARTERQLPRRLVELLEALRNPVVLDVLRGTSRTLWEPPDVSWDGWLRRRF
jgi:hypothetical protein